MDIKDFKLVEIQWVDSYGVTPSWEEIEDVIDDVSCTVIHSVGYVIKETADSISLASNICTKTSNVCGVMTIPKVSIKSRFDK